MFPPACSCWHWCVCGWGISWISLLLCADGLSCRVSFTETEICSWSCSYLRTSCCHRGPETVWVDEEASGFSKIGLSQLWNFITVDFLLVTQFLAGQCVYLGFLSNVNMNDENVPVISESSMWWAGTQSMSSTSCVRTKQSFSCMFFMFCKLCPSCLHNKKVL